MSQTVRFTIDESGSSAIFNRWPGRLGSQLHIGQIVSIRTDGGRVERVRITEHDMRVHLDPSTGVKFVWVTGEVVEPALGGGHGSRAHISKMQRMVMSGF